MPLEPEILDALRNVNTTLTQLNTTIARTPRDDKSGSGRQTPFSSSLFRGSELAALQLRKQMSNLETSSKTFATTLKNVTPDLKLLNTVASDMFSEVASSLGVKQLETIPDRLRTVMLNSANVWVKNKAIEIQTLEDAEEFVKESKRRAENLAEMQRLQIASTTATAEEMDDLKERAKRLGFEVSELSLPFQELQERVKQSAVVVRETTAATTAAARSSVLALKSFSRAFMSFVPGALLLGKAVLTAASSAAKFGTQFDMTTSYWMAMAPEDLAAMQGEYKQSIMAAGGSVDEFNKRILDNQGRLIEYTGDLAIAARVVAGMSDAGMLLTGSVGQLDTFIEQQTTTFGRFNRVFSMTAEQFTEMNKQMLESANVRGQMLKIDKGLRQAYFTDLQQTYEGLRLKGLEHDAALQMVETLEGMGKKKALDRFKDAAKLQAVMGAYGMGAEGARAGQLLRGGLREPEQKKEFMDILKKANVTLGDKMGQSVAAEMLIQQTIQTTALDEYLGDNSQFVKLATAEGKQVSEVAANTQAMTRFAGEQTEILNGVMTVQQQLHKAITSDLAGAITALTAAVWAMAGSSFAGMFGKGAIGRIGAGIKGSAGLLKGGAQLGGTLGGAVGAINAYQETGSVWEATKSGAAVGGGAAAGQAVGGVLGAIAGPAGIVVGQALGGIVGGYLGDVIYDTFLANDPEKEAEETQKREEKRTKAVTKLTKQLENEERRLTEVGVQLAKTRATIESGDVSDAKRLTSLMQQEKTLSDEMKKLTGSVGGLAQQIKTENTEKQKPTVQVGEGVRSLITTYLDKSITVDGVNAAKQKQAITSVDKTIQDFVDEVTGEGNIFLPVSSAAEDVVEVLALNSKNLGISSEKMNELTRAITESYNKKDYRAMTTATSKLREEMTKADLSSWWSKATRENKDLAGIADIKYQLEQISPERLAGLITPEQFFAQKQAELQSRQKQRQEIETAINDLIREGSTSSVRQAEDMKKTFGEVSQEIFKLAAIVKDDSEEGRAALKEYLERYLKTQQDLVRIGTEQKTEMEKQTEATEKGCKANQRMMYIRAPTRAVTASR